jgi:signal transduction histidine kinase
MTKPAAAAVGRAAPHTGSTDVLRFLRRLPLLAALHDADLEHVAQMARRVRVAAGRVIMREGGAADGLYVLVRGRLEVTKRDGGEEVLLAMQRPGSFVGEMALLGGAGRTATVRAVRPSELLVIAPEAFRELLVASPDAALMILKVVAERLAGTEAALLQREKLASLGTLAAGLAHELNNPAAAAGASALHMATAVRTLESLARRVGASTHVARTAAGLHADVVLPGTAAIDADARERLADWLREHHPGNVRALAHALAACSWDPDRLAALTRDLDAAERGLIVEWLAARCSVATLAGEIVAATRAIRDVVAAVRTHVNLDRAPVSMVDLRASIEAALVVLRSRWKAGVTVSLDVADDAPAIEAHAGELSQVWSNLISNAVDAMEGRGALRIRAVARGKRVVIEFEDDGPGIPRELRRRVFEPFRTTKPPHAGMGLGLHIVRSIVVHRHGGRIELRSRPGRTVFRVTLPIRRGRTAVR